MISANHVTCQGFIIMPHLLWFQPAFRPVTIRRASLLASAAIFCVGCACGVIIRRRTCDQSPQFKSKQTIHLCLLVKTCFVCLSRLSQFISIQTFQHSPNAPECAASKYTPTSLQQLRTCTLHSVMNDANTKKWMRSLLLQSPLRVRSSYDFLTHSAPESGTRLTDYFTTLRNR